MNRGRRFVSLALVAIWACATPQPSTVPAATAKVASVQVSRESVMYVSVTLNLKNDGTGPCRVSEYVVTWPGGTKAATPTDLVVPAGDERERTLRVDPDDGELDALLDRWTEATVVVSCD